MRSVQKAAQVRTARAEDDEWDLYEKVSEMPNLSVYELAKLMSWTTGKTRGAAKRARSGGAHQNREDHPEWPGRASGDTDSLAGYACAL